MDARRSIEAVWRIECPRLVASLTRLLRDVGLAEEVAQDVFVAALEQWPRDGVPDRPGAWLMAAARNRAIDRIRRERGRDERYALLAEPDVENAHVPEAIDDDLLALVFVTCHPVLPRESRVALTLRLLGGLSTEEVARAFLVPSPTIGQRISRAKRTLAETHVPFEVPQEDELPERLAAVLEVVYLGVQRGLLDVERRGVDPPRPRARGDATGTRARGVAAKHARGARASGADGAAGVAVRGAHCARWFVGVTPRSGPHADGPEAALAALDAIDGDPRLTRYHLLGATRADVLRRLGRDAEADEELRRAAALAPTERERDLLLSRTG